MPITTYSPSVLPLAGNVPVSLGELSAASFEQGYSDTILGWLERQSENMVFGDEGDELDPQEIQSRYGFKSPVPMREGRAQLLATRKRAEEQRMLAIQNGMNGVGTFAASLGAGLVGSVANPVDFAANVFLPVVGPARRVQLGAEAVEQAGMLGRIGTRLGTFARGGGIISEAEIAAMGLPRGPVFAAMLEGAVANAAIEVPLAYEKIIQEHSENYGISDSLLNVGLGAGFAGGLRLAGKALGRMLGQVSPEAHLQALRAVMDGEEPARVIVLDDAVIRQIVQQKVDARVAAELGAVAVPSGEAVGVGPDALIDILRRRAEAAADTTEGRLVQRLWQRAIDGERDAGFLSQVAQAFGLRYDPSETRMPQQFAEGRGGKSTRTADYERAQGFLAFSEAETRLAEVEAKIAKAEAEGGRAENADYVARHNYQKKLEQLKKEGFGMQGLSAIELEQHRATVAAEAERARAQQQEIERSVAAERERLTRQYFEELMPKTDEERKQFSDRYHAEQAAEDARAAQQMGVKTDEQIKAAAETKTVEQVAQDVSEDIAALRQQLPPEMLAALDAGAKGSPNFKKGFEAVIGCIRKTL